MMEITRETLEKILSLAKIKVKDEDRMLNDLVEIASMAEVLSEFTLSECDFENVSLMREDVEEASYEREELLANAPERAGGFFVVPRTVGEA